MRYYNTICNRPLLDKYINIFSTIENLCKKLVKSIQSLDTLNDQIVQFIFNPKSCQIDLDSENYDESIALNGTNGTNPQSKQQREALKSSMALMRRLLVDAQAKFRKMVEDNKQLASRIDGDIQTAQDDVTLLRAELADTNKRINELSSGNLTASTATVNGEASSTSHNGVGNHNPVLNNELSNNSLTPSTLPDSSNINGDVDPSINSCPPRTTNEKDENHLKERLSSLEEQNEKLTHQNRSLQREVEELQKFKENAQNDEEEFKPKIQKLEGELMHAKEALSALKQDRKRLKSEKFDLLNQMKQLFGTLEDKEKELREFIRSYEHCMRESEKNLKRKRNTDDPISIILDICSLGMEIPVRAVSQVHSSFQETWHSLEVEIHYEDNVTLLARERDESEREKWKILKHARDEAERSVTLCAKLGQKEGHLKQLEEENRLLKERCKLENSLNKSKSSRLNSSGEVVDMQDHSIDRDSNATPTPSCMSSPQPTITIDSDYSPSHANTTPKDNLSPSLHPGSPQGLSRSAEEIYNSVQTLPSSAIRKKQKKKENRSTWNSISRVFSRGKQRKTLDPSVFEYDKRASWSPPNSLCASPLNEDGYAEKIRLLEEAQTIPMDRWKATMVLAWLEVSLGMGLYVQKCGENVKSGKVLLELNDSELESGIGIQNHMHRRKLRLAIEEHRDPSNSVYQKIPHITHVWVITEWLPSLGLTAYCDIFSKQLVDGRMLERITKKELDKYLAVSRKFHQVSVMHGIELLRVVQFDKEVLIQRRNHCENMDIDPLVWTNQRFIKWAKSIDLGEYADNLRDSGVHGALVVLEPSFNAEAMATALGIPTSKNIIRRHLTTELENLIQPARMSLEAESVVNTKKNKFPTGSLGRNFVRSYSKNSIDKADKRRTSLRFAAWTSSQGSLTKALGLKMKQELQSSPSLHSAKDTSCSSITTSFTSSSASEQSHRRVRSQSDIDTVTVTPV
ncbi:Kazrin [Nymphon striatum]|nr:Kazrin [Nymphon striatum]